MTMFSLVNGRYERNQNQTVANNWYDYLVGEVPIHLSHDCERNTRWHNHETNASFGTFEINAFCWIVGQHKRENTQLKFALYKRNFLIALEGNGKNLLVQFKKKKAEKSFEKWRALSWNKQKKNHEIRKMVTKYNNVTSFFLLSLLNINESFGAQFKWHPLEDGKQKLKHIFHQFVSEGDFQSNFELKTIFTMLYKSV